MCDDVPLPERVQKTYWSIRVENYPETYSVEVTSGGLLTLSLDWKNQIL